MPLHRKTFTHRSFCTQHAFTHSQLLHGEALLPLLDRLPFAFPLLSRFCLFDLNNLCMRCVYSICRWRERKRERERCIWLLLLLLHIMCLYIWCALVCVRCVCIRVYIYNSDPHRGHRGSRDTLGWHRLCGALAKSGRSDWQNWSFHNWPRVLSGGLFFPSFESWLLFLFWSSDGYDLTIGLINSSASNKRTLLETSSFSLLVLKLRWTFCVLDELDVLWSVPGFRCFALAWDPRDRGAFTQSSWSQHWSELLL